MSLRAVERPAGAAFEAFLLKHHPLSLRLRGALAEAGGAAAVWMDDPAAPRLAVHAARRWLLPVGEAGALLAHLDGLGALSARLNEGTGDEGLLKLSSLPPDLRDAVAAARRPVRQSPCGLYTLQEEDFRPFREGPPVESLREEDAAALAALSEYGHEVSYCLDRIRGAPSAAIRLGGELASFMIVHASGDIGMLRTLDGFRNRRLARGIVTALVERQWARGREVFCYIVDGNAPSQRVFLGLGFRRAADVVWAAFEGGSPAGR
ncbi:MAG: hypothetical protein A3J27_07405 [Candidatus Tectomicrobia bacterium RIFCSPLOWO2_12_FULL_69_37]|nr:MAG: hypothetical protein A3I72_10215 [Candidatus Tectomicrobia bacterium RIFCSPLOWO2_02_FULL_70_19]OGL64277.1 MAG: hypothetical protein A3J27_07405 [Candidatus Tectomicrobia bacterium RIFCSPLOWO2_12_FULL_69_37]